MLTIVLKLMSADTQEQDYVFQYVSLFPVQCFDAPSKSLVREVNERLRAGDKRFLDMVKIWERWSTTDSGPNSKWTAPFSDAVSNFVEAEPVDVDLGEDELPF
jgi:hypothetical protein